MYRVLWFDDEFDSNKGINIIDNANEEYIELIGVSNAKVGIEMLTSSPESYDAILLDGLFFAGDSEQEKVTDVAFREVAKTILQLKAQGNLYPWFVYSAQKEFVKSKNSYQSTFEDDNYGQRTYDKNSDQDQIDLWQDIINACNEKETIRIRLKHLDLLKICEDEYIGSKQHDRLFKLLSHIEDPASINNSQDLLNPMRKIVEAIFDKLNTIGVIPDEVRKGQGGINGSSVFLSGFHSDYNYKNEVIHPMVAENIYRLLNITQDGSHNVGAKLRADDYLSASKSHNLYKSAIYLLLDILEYMKCYIDDNSNKEKNQRKWILKENDVQTGIVSGTVTRIADNKYGTFLSDDSSLELTILPHLIDSHSLMINQKINVTTKPNSDNTKTFIDEIVL